MLPVPWQMSQVTGEVPGWQQQPLQVSQTTAVSTSRSRCVPKMTSSRSSSTRRSASWPRSRRDRGPAAAAAAAEERLEDVAEAAEVAAAEAAALAAQVVLLALFRVAEHVVGVRDRLEPLGCLGPRVHVGVQLPGEAAVRLLDLVGGGIAGDAEDFVVVSHGGLSFRLPDAGGAGTGGRTVSSRRAAGKVACDGTNGRHVVGVVHAGRAEHAEPGEVAAREV